MKQNFKLFVLFLSVISLLYGCAASAAGIPSGDSAALAETSPDVPEATQQTADTTPNTEPEPLSYEIWERSYRLPSNDQILIIRTYAELCALYDGQLPDYAEHDEAFFEDHSLILISYASGGIPFALNLGELTQDESGVYHLELESCNPELVSDMCLSVSFALEVNRSLDPEASIFIDYTDTYLPSKDFEEQYPDASCTNVPINKK